MFFFHFDALICKLFLEFFISKKKSKILRDDKTNKKILRDFSCVKIKKPYVYIRNND